MNTSALDAMSLKTYAPVIGGSFTVNRPRMFAAACEMVGVHRRFPLSMPNKTGWQTVSQTNDYSQKCKNIESIVYRRIELRDKEHGGLCSLNSVYNTHSYDEM